jgi:hypothetical protein
MTERKPRPRRFNERQLAKVRVRIVNSHNLILTCETCGQAWSPLHARASQIRETHIRSLTVFRTEGSMGLASTAVVVTDARPVIHFHIGATAGDRLKLLAARQVVFQDTEEFFQFRGEPHDWREDQDEAPVLLSRHDLLGQCLDNLAQRVKVFMRLNPNPREGGRDILDQT